MRAILLAGLLLLLGCTDNSQLYQNTPLGFSLRLPASVQLRENYMGSAVVIEPRADSALAGKLRYLSVDVNEAKSATSSLESYSQFRLKGLQHFAVRSEITHREEVKLAAYPAQRLRMNVQFGAQESELLLHYLIAGGRGYTFTAAFPPNADPSAIKVVDSIITSFSAPLD